MEYSVTKRSAPVRPLATITPSGQKLGGHHTALINVAEQRLC